jgi:hypothetical protein
MTLLLLSLILLCRALYSLSLHDIQLDSTHPHKITEQDLKVGDNARVGGIRILKIEDGKTNVLLHF